MKIKIDSSSVSNGLEGEIDVEFSLHWINYHETSDYGETHIPMEDHLMFDFLSIKYQGNEMSLNEDQRTAVKGEILERIK